jgi:hypothetical protein
VMAAPANFRMLIVAIGLDTRTMAESLRARAGVVKHPLTDKKRPFSALNFFPTLAY